jgi:hypothetical protein
MIRRGRKSSAEIMLAKRFAIASSEKKQQTVHYGKNTASQA